MKRIIYTDEAPNPIGPYSQAVFTTGNLLFISGQIGVNPQTNSIKSKNIKGQTKQVLKNITAILKKENLTLNNIIKCDVYLKNIKDYNEFNKIYKDYFKEYKFPARVLVEVSNLPKDALIEISAIAAHF